MIRFDRVTAKASGARCSIDALELGTGATCFVGAASDGVGLALALAAGAARPSSGRVLRGGVATDVARVRRKTAFVPLDPSLPAELTVSEWLALAASLRGDSMRADATLARFDLTSLARARIGSLEPAQRRALVLAEGLASVTVDLVVVHEPLAWLEGLAQSALVEGATTDASRTWLFGAASASDAARVATRALRCVAGKIVADGVASELAPDARYDGVLVNTPDARALANALVGEAAVRGLDVGDGVLVVRARDAREAAEVVGRAVVRVGADVRALERLARSDRGAP